VGGECGGGGVVLVWWGGCWGVWGWGLSLIFIVVFH